MVTAINNLPGYFMSFTKLVFICIWLSCNIVNAEVRFDVFMGFSGKARNGEWFPVTVEIENDGPTFSGEIEIKPSSFNEQSIRYKIELPNNTRKRLSIPVFNNSNYRWNAKLLNDGKVVSKNDNLRIDSIPWFSKLFAAVSDQQSSGPVLPETRFKNNNANRRFSPVVVNIQADIFPDNPVTLHGLSSLYLNSKRAINFRAEQASAVSIWVRSGGHLILGVDQPSDITGTPWLRELLNTQFGLIQNLEVGPLIRDWLSNAGYPVGAIDEEFNTKLLNATPVRLKDGKTLMSFDGETLIANANRGLGQVTILGFNPEREPIRSWENRAWLWARLADIDSEWFVSEKPPRDYGRMNVDGLYGMMIDSRQVSKLPVIWLILLLITYLVIIGPVDRIWLKRINKQMLTWLTFPIYVIFFSFLIYYIGYRLRAGQLEINELHIVDVLPGDQVALRGRSYASIYSPSNKDYLMGGSLALGAFRNESSSFSNGAGNQPLLIGLSPGKLEAKARVPIWTSRLFSSEWVSGSEVNIQASVTKQNNDTYQLEILNGLRKPIVGAAFVALQRIVYDESINITPGERGLLELKRSDSKVRDVISGFSSNIRNSIQSRNRAFGNAELSRMDLGLMNIVTGSFPGMLELEGIKQFKKDVNQFDSSGGMDISEYLERDGSVLFVFVEDQSPISSTGLFESKLRKSHSLYRIPIKLLNKDGDF
ncbi:MAG: hypothetical protein CBC27_07700 [Opitutia bacterium TMED67]|nr:MAG: hypothetical protein CBC27_07700 [Opitutae bacterium TMED67]